MWLYWPFAISLYGLLSLDINRLFSLNKIIFNDLELNYWTNLFYLVSFWYFLIIISQVIFISLLKICCWGCWFLGKILEIDLIVMDIKTLNIINRYFLLCRRPSVVPKFVSPDMRIFQLFIVRRNISFYQKTIF